MNDDPSGVAATGNTLDPVVLDIEGLQRHFTVSAGLLRKAKVVRAVDGVSLKLRRGKTLSIVGESGCGKSTLARVMLGLDDPTGGKIFFDGRDIATLRGSERRAFRLSVQAVFQDPTASLDPKRRIHQILAEPLVVNLKLKGAELQVRIHALLDAVGLNHAAAGAFPHELSGGMRQRVAVAHALALNPRVIVLDEPVSALDVSIRAQIMNLLKELQDRHGLSYIMISHDLGTVRYLSHEVAAMYVGEVVELAPSDAFFDLPLHPYTVSLISAVGTTKHRAKGRILLEGETASPAREKIGCSFAPRCWLAKQLAHADCQTRVPMLRQIGQDRQVACHHADLLADPLKRAALIAAATKPSLSGAAAAAVATQKVQA